MSDVLTLMEDFIKAERYPSLVKFCAAHENPIKAYISHFESAVAAKKKRGFYADGDLHEILCLSDVLFLKENEYSDEQISHFGATDLDRLQTTLATKYIDSKAKFDTNLYNQVSEILQESISYFIRSDECCSVKTKNHVYVITANELVHT